MKNLKKLIAIAVASSMVMSTTVFAKTTTANKTANYQKADTTYGENLQSVLDSSGLPTSITGTITTLYNMYGMTSAQETAVLDGINTLYSYAKTLKAADASITTTSIMGNAAFQVKASSVLDDISYAYGVKSSINLDANNKPTSITVTDRSGKNPVYTVNFSDITSALKGSTVTASGINATDMQAKLKTALDAAVAASANGANTEMPVATTTATSTATTGAATGTTATGTTATGTTATGTTATGTTATGTTTGGTTNPGAGAGTGGDVATGITYGQALNNIIAASGLPASVTGTITTLYNMYGMTPEQETAVLNGVNTLYSYAKTLKAADPTITATSLMSNAAFEVKASSVLDDISYAYGVKSTINLDSNNKPLSITITDRSGKNPVYTVNFSDITSAIKGSTVTASGISASDAIAKLKTVLDAAVAATTYGSTTVIPTATGTTTTPGTTTATTTPGTTTATTTPGTTTATTTPGTTTATTTPGTATAPTPVQDLANNLTNLGVPANLVTTITNTLNALPSNVADKVASIVNTFLKSARSATDLATAKAAIDADSTLTDAQKTAAKAALDQVAILAPATTTPATGTATGTTTPDTSAILQLVNTIGNNAQDALNALETLFTKDPVAANALSAKINAYLSSQTQANYDAALAAINSADLTQAEKDALIKIIGARPAVDATTSTSSSTTSSSSTSGTTPSVLPKTATEAANMAVAGLAMITIAGTVFFISKKRMA